MPKSGSSSNLSDAANDVRRDYRLADTHSSVDAIDAGAHSGVEVAHAQASSDSAEATCVQAGSDGGGAGSGRAGSGRAAGLGGDAESGRTPRSGRHTGLGSAMSAPSVAPSTSSDATGVAVAEPDSRSTEALPADVPGPDAASSSRMDWPSGGSGTVFVLASGSPARAATLRAAGIEPMIEVSNADEDAVLAKFADPESAAEADEKVVALAEAKAAAVLPGLTAERLLQFARAQGMERPRAAIVVACDSMLEVDGALVGKPHSPQVARERIRELSGNDVVLHTGHAVSLIRIEYEDAGADGARVSSHNSSGAGSVARVGDGVSFEGAKSASCSTTVHFGVLEDAEIEAYVATGEPLEVAGSFTIDGLGGAFIEGVTGDPHSVVGISLPLLRHIAKDLGVFWPSLWNRLAN